MASNLAAAPVLSTPDDHILETPAAASAPKSTLSDDQLRSTYEIRRTAREIRQGGWKTIALQFPDHMLVDAPRITQLLDAQLADPDTDSTRRIHILADTSYSACCVDEIAAEHAAADVVVHYGRTCLSPTSRLPVIHVYTSHRLDGGSVVAKFGAEFADKTAKVVVMADLTYQDHVDGIVRRLKEAGYTNVLGTSVARDPAATIPNRRIEGPQLTAEAMGSYALFHISDPPTSLLLALQTRFASLHVLSTTDSSATVDNPTVRAAGLLRRRFARVLSLASAGVVGILVNTLSVSNYQSSIDLLRTKIAQAGKKSYTVVVGKLNPAKLANFAEIQGWVVVGCWESGLIEDDVGYWRPVVTPFEMEVALMSEEERIWGGEWWGGIERLKQEVEASHEGRVSQAQDHVARSAEEDVEGGVEGQESLPPQFDLRTGKLISHSRPMQLTVRSCSTNQHDPGNQGSEVGNTGREQSNAVTKRVVGELASINGVASPGAEYLRSKRTWQGLGTDFDQEASTLIEEGRSGVARGYHVGEDEARH